MSKQRLKYQSKVDLNCNGQPIESMEEVKYLGANIDNTCILRQWPGISIKKPIAG